MKRFEFYIDKHFTDDLYARVLGYSDIKLGFFVYNSFMKLFVHDEVNLYGTLKYNKFLLYKRYFIERYLVMIKNIDLILYEYLISRKDNQQVVFSYYDLFIPAFNEKRFEFDFKKDLVKDFVPCSTMSEHATRTLQQGDHKYVKCNRYRLAMG